MSPSLIKQSRMPVHHKLRANWLVAALLAVPLVAGAQQALAQGAVAGLLLSSITISEQAKPAVSGPGIDASTVPELNSQDLMDRLKEYLNKPLSRNELLEILGAINAQLAKTGSSFSVASFPEQDLTEGRLTVLITRSRIGSIRIKNTGADAFTEARYRSLLSIQPGDLLSQDALDADIDWIGRSNSFRSASVITQAGKNPGETDVSFMVNDRKPLSLSLAYDNSGSRTTGRDRVTFSVGLGNVFDLDHQASYTLNANPQFDRLVSHNLGYVIPLASRHVLSLSANLANIKSDLGAPLDSSGQNMGFTARYDVPFKNRPGYQHGMNVGFDFKRSNNNLLFNGLQVTNTTTDIFQFNLGYSGTLQDSYGQTSFGLNWTHSPGGLSQRNKDAVFTQSRANASAQYNYQVLTVERNTRLPERWNWLVSGRLQFSDSNLLGSEQLAAGGVGSVRGSAEAVAYGDQGMVLRTEVQSPFAEVGTGAQLTRVQGVVFIDHAQVGNKNLLAGEAKTNQLSSFGVGVRVAFPSNIAMRVDAGRQFNVNVPGATPKNLIHVSLSAAL